MKTLLALLAVMLFGCGAAVEIQTAPVTQPVPVTSAGVDTYAELAVDLPPESQGDIQVQEVDSSFTVHNKSTATTMRFSLRVSGTGTATPGVPFAFTQANPPAYFSQAAILIGPKTYAPNTSTDEKVSGSGLVPLLGKPRIWIIVSNTVTNVGLGDGLPLELDLERMTIHATVNKSLEGLQPGAELGGL